MTTLKEKMAAAMAKAFTPELLGEEIEYSGVPVDGIFRLTAAPKGSSAGSKSVGELQVQVAEVPTWAVDDLVVIDGKNWRVKSAMEGSTSYKHVLQVESDRRMRP